MTPPVNIRFDDEHVWGSAGTRGGNRPETELILHGPRKPIRVWALIDSGADFMQLDLALATAVGLQPTMRGTRQTVSIASGGVSVMWHLAGVDITVEGNRVTVDGYFAAGVPSLLGRTAIVRAMSFGLRSAGWLYKI